MLITDQDIKTMGTAMPMKYKFNSHHGIYITEFDKKRLKGLIKFAEERWDNKVLRYLEDLDAELDRAEVVKPEEIPTDVITMNSTFRLSDLDTGEEVVYTLVFPADADSKNRKISVLAPVGTAVLGYRVGDTVEWEVPAGIKRFKVDEIVYQPEAAREYHY
jgi:regulator of nucleoside diphosphate kinase